jgi:hypothetical protein
MKVVFLSPFDLHLLAIEPLFICRSCLFEIHRRPNQMY